VIEAHVCEQLAQGGYLTGEWPGVEPVTSKPKIQCLDHYTTTTRLPGSNPAGANF